MQPNVKINKPEKQYPNEFKLNLGDIIETVGGNYFLVVCDGYGQYFFVNIETSFIISDNKSELRKYSYNQEYAIGDYIDKDQYYAIVNVYRREEKEVEIIVNLK